jgi:hypothetical protein
LETCKWKLKDGYGPPGVCILENTHQPMSFGGKNMKRGREKVENVKEKEGRGKK